MDVRSLLKQKKDLEKQLVSLEKTYKSGLLTKTEYNAAKKRVKKKVAPLDAQLKQKKKGSSVVRELLKDDAPKKRKVVRKPVRKVPTRKVVKKPVKKVVKKPVKKVASPKKVKKKIPIQKVVLPVVKKDDSPLDTMKDMKIADVKAKAAVMRIEQDLAKRKKVNEIMSSIDKIDDIALAKLAEEKRNGVEKKEELFGSPLPQHNLDKLYESDPASRWKIALVVLGIFLVVLLYMKFSASGLADDGDIVFVLYGDYSCEYCAEVYTKVGQLKEVYGDRFIFLYKHVPLSDPGLQAASAVECAADQGQFLPYHDLLYASHDRSMSRAAFILYASELSLDVSLFEKCLDSGVKTSLVEKEKRKALDFGIDAVPTVVLQNTKKLVGDFSVDEYVREINLLIDGQDSGVAEVTE